VRLLPRKTQATKSKTGTIANLPIFTPAGASIGWLFLWLGLAMLMNFIILINVRNQF
jgi:hypothetical protein